MLCVLIGIGVTQPRGTSLTLWCFFYVAIAVFFVGLVVVALLYQHAGLTEMLLGVSAGAAIGLAIHASHHIFEERKGAETSSDG